MTTRTAYANQANAMAGSARVRAFRPCAAVVPVTISMWSPITLGTTDAGHKHGRPRRLEASHP